MIINVSNAALTPGEQDYLIRRGALTSLVNLTNAGHTFTFSDDTDPAFLKLIEQEKIPIDKDPVASPDLVIDSNSDELVVKGEHIYTYSNWDEITSHLTYPTSRIEHQRNTNETTIAISLNLFGSGKSDISTGLGFFDHMLDQIAKHALIDLELTCNGDLHIDEHHTIEDVGIALGEALYKAIGNKKGLERFGFVLPMDEANAIITMDLSGRPYLTFSCPLKREYVGDFPTEMTEHFFYSLAMNLKATLQIDVGGENDHHKIEATFKGFARTLRQALIRLERSKHVIPSSKGTL